MVVRPSGRLGVVTQGSPRESGQITFAFGGLFTQPRSLIQAWIGSKPILAGGCSSCSISLLAASPR
jgi:hypothetical protein